MTRKRLPVDAMRCGAMRCDEVVGGALPCFSQIQGSSLDSVCVWFMRKIEGPKEVGRSSARRSRASREKGNGWVGEGPRCRRGGQVCCPSGLSTVE